MNPPLVIRLGNIPFSKPFYNVCRDRGIKITRKDTFNKNCIILNHGNQVPITISSNVKVCYLLNQPNSIHTCSNKRTNMNILPTFYPKVYKGGDAVEFPVVIKTPHGFQGTGVKKAIGKRQFERVINLLGTDVIIEEYIPIRSEYRFNVFDKTIYQISRKDMVSGWESKFEFEWVSLGDEAKLSSSFYKFVDRVIDTLYNEVGDNLCSYAIDVIKSENGKYYLSEINTAFGIGEFTADRLIICIENKLKNKELLKYRVK